MVLVAVLASLAVLVPSRFERLITFITSPTVVFSNPAINGIIHNYASRTMSITIIIGQLASLLLGYITWKSCASFKFADLSLVIAALVSTFVLSSPVIGMEWSDRLAALSFAPLSIAAIIIFGTVQIAWQKSAVAILASVTLLATVSSSGTQMKYVFEDVALKDFKDLVAQVDIPDNSVIVARHGVEYLAAWEFESDVTLDTYYSSADLSSYDSVYYIQEIKAEGPGTPPASGKGPSDKKDKGDAPVDSKKSEVVTGQTVYQNASFAMIKVR